MTNNFYLYASWFPGIFSAQGFTELSVSHTLHQSCLRSNGPGETAAGTRQVIRSQTRYEAHVRFAVVRVTAAAAIGSKLRPDLTFKVDYVLVVLVQEDSDQLKPAELYGYCISLMF